MFSILASCFSILILVNKFNSIALEFGLERIYLHKKSEQQIDKKENL
jgi:hypothetical protein